ncbi:MAG: glutamine synthetase [Anaerolineae bacterium]|nr:glutamine synthetase [Anaerolineae bacterium]
MDDKARAVLQDVQDKGVRFIDLQFTDVIGTTKSVTIPAEHLDEALDRGIWFDGSSIQGFARIQESDMFLRPDVRSYRILPWTGGDELPLRARIICDIHGPDGEPFEGDPRYALKRQIARLEAMGYSLNVGPELEFFLFRKNGDLHHAVPHDVGGYFDFSPNDEAQRVRSDIVSALQALKIDVETEHHEVAIGQHEIDFKYSEALHTADNAVTFKYTVKGIAAKHGLIATFMPKPVFGINGSGMHCHQSFIDLKTGENAFYDGSSDTFRLSNLAQAYVAGQLKHARAMSAVVAPTVNSYKRLTPGYEAPVYICWAQRNRSALIRIPRYSPGREMATRVELRFPDPSANPYLAFAVMLAAGLEGIEQGMTPPAPVTDDVYEWTQAEREANDVGVLPGSLKEALDELEQDHVLQEALGEHIYSAFHRAKSLEWDEFRMHVSEWERERYLETL